MSHISHMNLRKHTLTKGETLCGYAMSLGREDFNYTYNVSKMWYACYPEHGIREIYGMTGRQAASVLFNLAEFIS